MITFILNNEHVSTGRSSGSSLLDFIRHEMELTGTKSGCREGDCGACTVLMGTLEDDRVHYQSVVSCLTPLGNAQGKHIVTIEGVRSGLPSLMQKAFADHSATQCGFCTPGFIMAMTAECLSREKSSEESLIAAMSGNICRCTGYKSIERAAVAIAEIIKEKDTEDPAGWLIKNRLLPEYFRFIPERLQTLRTARLPISSTGVAVAGGTDIMVHNAEGLAEINLLHLMSKNDLRDIRYEKGKCIIGSATTVSEFCRSETLQKMIPSLTEYSKLIASEPVRNMATLGGNITNASPIGDFSIMLLALNAMLIIEGAGGTRPVPLKHFFAGYKKTDLREGEFIKSIVINYTPDPLLFSFEKVSRRTHLDIASVNSALRLSVNDGLIEECDLSAGGVSPVPLFLDRTAGFLKGRPLTPDTVINAVAVMQGEVSPISDVRGSEQYKRLLLRQLFFAHFIKLFPGMIDLPIERL